MAGEIYIADKVTLDSVKKDTSEILLKGSGTDWSKYTCEVVTAYNSSASFKTALDISGKGILKSISCRYQEGTSATIRLTIDGVIKEFTIMNYLDICCVFNNNLKVEIKAHADGYSVSANVSYGLER